MLRHADPSLAATVAGRRARWLAERWPALMALVVALPIAGVTALGTLDWLGRPFPGFFLMGNGVVPTVGLHRWPGLGGVVPFHSRVLTVDGRAVRTNRDVYDYVEGRPVGTPVRYEVEKDGRRFTRTIPTMRFGPSDYWLTVGLLVAFGLLSIGAGVVVGLLQPHKRAAQAFLVEQTLTGLFALSGTALYHPELQWLSRFHFVTQCLFPAAFIHLGLVFPVERRVVERHPAVLALPYAVAAGLSAWILVGFYASLPQTTPLYASYLWAAASIVLLSALVAFAFWENRTPLVRPQVRVVLPGLVVGTIIGLYGFLDNAGSGGEFPIQFIAVTPIFFYLSVGWAITRYDLFDVDELVRQTAVYGTMTVGITAAYAGAVAVLEVVLPPETIRASQLFNVAFVVGVAMLFQPLRASVQHAIDRTFFRSRPDYRRIVGDVSSALTSLLDQDEILARVGHTITQAFGLPSMAVVLWLGTGSTVRRFHEDGERITDEDAPDAGTLHRILSHAPRRSWQVTLEGDRVDGGAVGLAAADAARVLAVMRQLDAALIVPLAVAGRVTGAFVLGRKRSGLPYGAEDLELLRTLAANCAVAMQNAVSYRALLELNAQLEARVQARTAALETSNAELEQAYGELKAAQAQLVRTEKLASLGQLVAGVAHEINNPVSFIVGNMEPLANQLVRLRAMAERHGDAELSATAARVASTFDLIGRGAERTAGIVNDLRSFSRMGDGIPQPTDVHEGLEVTLRLLKPRWGGRVEIHREYGELPPVIAIGGQLNQVLMNVVANACEAIPGEGNIWIRTVRDGAVVRIAVRDDGDGIAPEHLDRIFDPFFTTKPQGKGTGLGLAISYGIVSSHGGTIEVHSTPGSGTEFVVTLPIDGPPRVQEP